LAGKKKKWAFRQGKKQLARKIESSIGNVWAVEGLQKRVDQGLLVYVPYGKRKRGSNFSSGREGGKGWKRKNFFQAQARVPGRCDANKRLM